MILFSERVARLTPIVVPFLAISLCSPVGAMEVDDCLSALSMQLSQGIELNLEQVAQSIKALGEEYARIYEAAPPMAEAEKEAWMKRAVVKGKIVRFQPALESPEPGCQASAPAYLFYNGRHITPNVTRSLKAFIAMAPLFKVSYENFDYSWLYITTVGEAFFIYPHFPMDQAANNLPPTNQGFYKAADFEGRNFGWQRPYLDLAGTGMIVTVSYPGYTAGKNSLG